MGIWPADEVVVIVKWLANEDAETYLRRKLTTSGEEAGGEGWNVLTRYRPYYKLMCRG
jgi:hypothetical protein